MMPAATQKPHDEEGADTCAGVVFPGAVDGEEDGQLQAGEDSGAAPAVEEPGEEGVQTVA